VQLTVVLPAYNEEGNVERAVREAAAAVQPLVDGFEIVAVDDVSRDGTVATLQRLVAEFGERLRVITHPVNQGYGVALRDGFQAARGALVFYTDSDNQFDLRELRDFLPLMSEYDAVLGYRLDRQDPALRKFTSRVFNTISSLAFGMRVRDLNCSFKLFQREAIQSLPLETTDFFIDTELVARLHQARFRYVQRGVRHYPCTAGHSSVRPGDVPRTPRSLVRIWRGLRAEPPPRTSLP